MNIIFNICENIFIMLHAMAPYLLLGFGFSGLLSVIISQDQIQDKIGKKTFSSVLKAVLYGIPLPLCSCGVIPVSASLKKHGASKGSIISFLTTTPQTGIDSIMVTYGMLGLPILILKLVVALFSGLFSGLLTNFFDKDLSTQNNKCYDECCDDNKGGIIKRALTYGFKILPKDIVKPLLVGLILAGFVGLLVQDDFSNIRESISEYHSIIKILIIMIISIPLYICATASIPVALMIGASLGSPGAAIALLIAGPATNLSTITTCISIVGKKATFIYVGSVFIFALLSGIIADYFITMPEISSHIHTEHINFFSYVCIFLLLGVLFMSLLNQKTMNQVSGAIKIQVKGMTCSHCEKNVVSAIMSLNGSQSVLANHQTGEVIIETNNFNLSQVKAALSSFNYEAHLENE